MTPKRYVHASTGSQSPLLAYESTQQVLTSVLPLPVLTESPLRVLTSGLPHWMLTSGLPHWVLTDKQTPWIRSHVSMVDLQNKYTYCLGEEDPVASDPLLILLGRGFCSLYYRFSSAESPCTFWSVCSVSSYLGK